MKKIYIIQLIITIFAFGNVQAQSGPVSPPCAECENLIHRTEPYNGTWYNPEQSGTGFSIDVQDGKLFGVYYGYDDDGKPLWLTFVNDLVPSDEPNVMWTIDADLTAFENGNSFNNGYISPSVTDYTSRIHIEFTQKNHAIFRVNNGTRQNIVPILYNIKNKVLFAGKTSYRFPDLNGIWVLINKFQQDGKSDTSNYYTKAYYISGYLEGFYNDDDIKDFVYIIWDNSLPIDPVIVGEIVCYVQNIENKLTEPTCEFQDSRGLNGNDPVDWPVYKMSIGGIGAFRLFGESAEGYIFEAIRLTVDPANEPLEFTKKTKIRKHVRE